MDSMKARRELVCDSQGGQTPRHSSARLPPRDCPKIPPALTALTWSTSEVEPLLAAATASSPRVASFAWPSTPYTFTLAALSAGSSLAETVFVARVACPNKEECCRHQTLPPPAIPPKKYAPTVKRAMRFTVPASRNSSDPRVCSAKNMRAKITTVIGTPQA